MTIMKISSRNLGAVRRRSRPQGAALPASWRRDARPPSRRRSRRARVRAYHANPESAAVAFDAMAKAVTERSKGALDMQFFGDTLITKEIEIMNAVKSGTIAMGSPAGAAATVFPEMGALWCPIS